MAAPVKNTCPDIDKYIRWIKMALVEERYLKGYNEREVFDAAVSMANELESCIGYLEDLRSSNDSLRCWGECLEEELHDAGQQINDLENHLEELKEKA